MSHAAVWLTASLWLPVGLLVVRTIRRWAPVSDDDEDAELQPLADGFMVLLWPLVVVLGGLIAAVCGLGRLAAVKEDDPDG